MLILFLFSCSENKRGSIFQKEIVNIDAVQKDLYSKFKHIDTSDAGFPNKLFLDRELNVSCAYQFVDYKPFWFDNGGLNNAGNALFNQLNALQNEGLNPDDYNVSLIHGIMQAVKNGGASNKDSVEKWDVFMTHSYLSAARDLLMGKDEKVLDEDWHMSNDSTFNGAKILANRFFKKDTTAFELFDDFRPKNKLYKAMLKSISFWQNLNKDSVYLNLKAHANFKNDSITNFVLKKELGKINPELYDKDSLSAIIAAYQRIHNLKVTSKVNDATIASLRHEPAYYIRKLIWNLTRMQFMPQSFGDEFVWVNIPSMKMQMIKNNAVAYECKAIVGKKSRATPSLNAVMTNVVFNPSWVIPPTILKNDVQSGINRSGNSYLKRKGFHAVNSSGKDVTNSVTSSNYKQFSYRQSPGSDNALGLVKFNLPNPWHIYLHDTPYKSAFSQDDRALSSGCIRLEHAKDFALYLLESKNYDSAKVADIISTKKTKTVNLEETIPVYIVYLTISLDNQSGDLIYLNDIYNKNTYGKEQK